MLVKKILYTSNYKNIPLRNSTTGKTKTKESTQYADIDPLHLEEISVIIIPHKTANKVRNNIRKISAEHTLKNDSKPENSAILFNE